jgi:hypothetical protein
MEGRLRAALILVSIAALGAGSTAFGADEAGQSADPADQSAQSRAWWRGPFGEEVSLLSVDRTSEAGPVDRDLRGLRVAYRFWQDEYEEMLGIASGGYYLGVKNGGNRRVLDAGAELVFWNMALGPARFGPRVRLGAEYREDEPGRGVGAVVSGGFQVAFWLSKRILVSVFAEREVGSHSGTRNQLAFSFGVGVARTPL